MANKSTVFNNEWTDQTLFPNYAKWVRPVQNDNRKFLCVLCSKTVSLSNMGIQALASHESGRKHKKNLSLLTDGKQPSISTLFESKTILNESVPSTSANPPAGETLSAAHVTSPLPLEETRKPAKSAGSISSFMLTQKAMKAEILWSCYVVMSHLSYNSCANMQKLFPLMFPDSQIADGFSLGRDKCAYIVCYGLAPYFKKQLFFNVKTSSCRFYVICFDEAMNKVMQRGQMDAIARFWNDETNTVESRYIGSAFLGHATADDMLPAFEECLGELPLTNLLQLSMDGPNVNWKFAEYIKSKIHVEEDDPKLLELGSCGLHIVHGAFQTGHGCAEWNVNTILGDMYYLFKDSPARRADFTRITGSSTFPLKFCKHRWIENVVVAKRALEMWPHVEKYIVTITPKPKVKSFTRLQDAIKDKFTTAKISFFQSVAEIVTPFLTKFQTPKPMIPFLYDDFCSCLRQLMQRVVKADILAKATTAAELCSVDLSQKSIELKPLQDIDIGVKARNIILKNKSSELQKKEFRRECRSFLLGVIHKLLERNPLKYKMVRGVSCLSPAVMLKDRDIALKRFDILINTLFSSNRIDSSIGDKASSEYAKFISSEKEPLQNFVVQDNRLDSFYASLLSTHDEYKNLFLIINFALILSHGNASVESGFSVNKSMLIENMQEQSLVSRRIVYDAVHKAGGVNFVTITSEMLQSVGSARSRYRQDLERKKAHTTEEMKAAVLKRKRIQELKALESKKLKITEEKNKELRNIDESIEKLKKM